MSAKSVDPADCFDPQLRLTPVDAALRRVLEHIKPLAASETVALPDALGRVTAHGIATPIDIPAHSNSAMDGFAIDADQLPASGTKSFKVAGTALAGQPWTEPCAKDEVVRVMTGAIMPDATDTVIIQEDVTVQDDTAVIQAGHKRNQNVRRAGEDLRRNQIILEAGSRINAAELGALASAGIARVEVIRKPVIGVFSTGDELRDAGDPLPKGSIYDANRYVIMGLAQRAGLSVMNFGIIPDDEDATLQALQKASRRTDAIITSGGVSTGSADFVIKALKQLGRIDLWRIAIRPGRPFAFGQIGQKPFFGMPGNPVAVMVTFFRLVQPALLKMMGQSNLFPVPILYAKAATAFRKKPNRAEVYRAVVAYDENAMPVVSSTGQQGSGLLHSMSQANCLVLLDDDAGSVQPGEMVPIQLFEGLN